MDVVRAVCGIIAADEGYHSRFGWEALSWLEGRLDVSARQALEAALPGLMKTFETTCFGGIETLRELADFEFTFERRPDNLGTLTRLEYAALFYHAMQETVLPGLEALGFRATHAWGARGV